MLNPIVDINAVMRCATRAEVKAMQKAFTSLNKVCREVYGQNGCRLRVEPRTGAKNKAYRERVGSATSRPPLMSEGAYFQGYLDYPVFTGSWSEGARKGMFGKDGREHLYILSDLAKACPWEDFILLERLLAAQIEYVERLPEIMAAKAAACEEANAEWARKKAKREANRVNRRYVVHVEKTYTVRYSYRVTDKTRRGPRSRSSSGTARS